MAHAQALLRSAAAPSASTSVSLSRRRQEQRIRSVAPPRAIPTSSSSLISTSSEKPKLILILFDLDNAPLPSQTPEIASAVVSVLARKMEDLLLRGRGGNGGSSGNASLPPPPSFPVRAAAFANEATVRSRPGLCRCLSSAGVSLVTVPSTRNAADAMVVSCAAGALSSSSSSSGEGEGKEGGLSGVVFCSADNYFSGFLRYASHKGVRTFVAGDFDNGGSKRGGGRRSGGGGRRGKKRGGGSTTTTSSSSSSSSDIDDGDETNDATLASWRKKELPAAADGAALWSDVLSEARELLLLEPLKK